MYRSKDVDYMTDLKQSVGNLSCNSGTVDSFEESWCPIKNYIIIDDLQKFLRSKYESQELSYVPEYIYNSNTVKPEVMFITLSEHRQELEVFDRIINKLGDLDYYRTSYLKTDDLREYQKRDVLIDTLKSEIKIIRPKKIVVFGLEIGGFIGGVPNSATNLSDVDADCIVTHRLLDTVSGKLSEEQKNILKHKIWCSITN